MRDRGTWVRRPRVAMVAASALMAGLVLAGCGVSSQPEPVRVGDGVAAGGGGSGKVQPPFPGAASNPETLVRLFLKASAGGGPAAVDHLKQFLTLEAQKSWPPEKAQQLTVVRLLNVSPGVAGGRTTVTVTYQTVGVLTEQGNITELVATPPATMTFDVVRLEENSSQLRIDRIEDEPPGLLLSDDTLVARSSFADDTYYLAHPIYFWDNTSQWLVPDVRYIPLTTEPEQRPNRMLQWLIDGPSPWLESSVVRLPPETDSRDAVVNRQGKLVVNLSAQAGAGGDEALRKLVYQLQWSLRTDKFPDIELQIEGQTRDVGSTADLNRFDAAAGLGAAQRFAIDGGRVVHRPPSGASPAPIPILDQAVNSQVTAAAVSRNLDLAAFVRPENGAMSLYVVRNNGDPRRVMREAESMGRPVVVPGANGQLLIVSDGHLYVIDARNRRRDITPPDLAGEITAVAIPPDARRIAFVADGKTYVAALDHGDGLSVGGQRRSILANQVPTAVAVAWASETNLLVAGATGANGGRPLLWQVTADGVAADDRSGALTSGLRPIDLVAYPESPVELGQGEITVVTNQGVGRLFTRLDIEPGLTNPFYAG